MKNRIFIFLLLGLFLMSFASSAEFDNAISDYDEETETITFQNGCIFDWSWTCMGDEIGKVQLKTPKDFHVARGYNYVWELDAWVYEDYNDFLKGFEFEDRKNGNAKVNRDIDVKMFMGMVNVSEPTYGCLEEITSGNGTICIDYGVNGTRLREVEDWQDATPADIRKSDGAVRLRGYTDVQEGDKIDWSPLIFGVRVSHDIWAVWTEDLNVDIIGAWHFDEASGDALDLVGSNDGTVTGATYEATGKVSPDLKCYSYNGNDNINFDTTITPIGEKSISFWFKISSTTGMLYSNSLAKASSSGIFIRTLNGAINSRMLDASNNERWNFVSSASTYADNNWHHLLFTWDGTTDTGAVKFYIDGAAAETTTSSIVEVNTPTANLRLMEDVTGGQDVTGLFDELNIWDRELTSAEATQLWNEGNGIAYTDVFGSPPSVVLTSPTNDSNLTSADVDFIAEVTDNDGTIVNVSFYLDGVLDETDTSGFNGTYTFSKTLTLGPHNWSILAYDNDSLANQSETWVLNYTGLAPVVTLTSPENNSNLTSAEVEYIVTVTDDEQVQNVTLYIDGVLNETDTSGFNGTYNFNKVMAEGIHNWSIFACDDIGLCTQSATRVFNYTQPPIDIQLYVPSDAFVSNIPLVHMNCSAMDPIGVEVLNLTIDGIVNETVTNTTVAENLTINKDVSFKEGIYLWGCSASNEMVTASSANRTLNISYSLPIVTLISPVNDTNKSTPSETFTFTATDINGIENVSLLIDGVLNQTNVSGVNGSYSFTQSFAEGLYNWTIEANSTLGKTSYSETRTLNVSYSLPIITLIAPPNDTNKTTPELNFTFTATDINGIENVSLIIDGVIDQTNTSGVNGSYQFTQTFLEGLYNWSIVANSILDKQSISEVRTLNFTFSSPEITLINPGDNTNTTNENVPFTFTATDDNGIENVSLYINGVLNETNVSGFNGTYIITKTLTEGFWNWSVVANSIFSKQTISSVYDFIIHLTAPNATIIAPIGEQGYFLIGDNETLEYSFTEPGQNLSEHLEECWYNYGIDEVGPFLSNSSFESVVKCWNPLNGTMTDFASGCPEKNLFPNINFPSGQYSLDPSSGFTISSLVENIPDCSNVEYSDEAFMSTGTNGYYSCLKDSDNRIYILQQNIFDNQRTNFTASNYSVNLNCTGTSQSFTYTEGQNNISIFTIDSFGFTANDTSTWEYKLLERNTTYNAATVEGSTETFGLSMTSSGTVIGASLIYNGTSYATEIYSLGGGEYNISSTITIPDFPIDTNATFYFEVTFENPGTLNTSVNSQFVSVLLIDDCTNYSNLILNVSLFDEKVLTPLVGTIETNLVVLDSAGSSVLSNVANTFYNNSNFEICSNINLSEGNLLYSLELRYYVDPDNSSNFLYVPEFYHIQKSPVSNFPQSIDLYDLNANDSTEFIITYQNDDFIFVEGAIVQLQRKYVGEGIYRTVEAPITSDGGKAIVHVDLNINKYRAAVVKDGVLLDVFEDIVFNCENELAGQCEEKLEGNVDPNNDIPIETILDFAYSVETSDDDNTVTVSFAIPSGTPTIVDVILEQKDMFGNSTSCNKTIIASAGSVICSYNDTIEASVLELSIAKSDENVALLSYIVDPDLDMDGINFFIIFLFMISLVGMAIASPEWMMIIGVMVLMISGTLLLVSGMNLVMGLGAIAWLVVAVGIIILKMSKQEDR